MTEPIIVATHFRVAGVRSDTDVRQATARLFDIFADYHLGQATFEVDPNGGPALLILKHLESAPIDQVVIQRALDRAGSFKIVS